MKDQEEKHRRNEIILIGVIVLLAAFYFLWKALTPAAEGAEVVVQVGGEEYARLPLSEDAELDIAQKGERHNHLVIRDGIATVTEATCPDGLCVHQADISRDGEMIVCLPNEVLITIENGEENELDGISK